MTKFTAEFRHQSCYDGKVQKQYGLFVEGYKYTIGYLAANVTTGEYVLYNCSDARCGFNMGERQVHPSTQAALAAFRAAYEAAELEATAVRSELLADADAIAAKMEVTVLQPRYTIDRMVVRFVRHWEHRAEGSPRQTWDCEVTPTQALALLHSDKFLVTDFWVVQPYTKFDGTPGEPIMQPMKTWYFGGEYLPYSTQGGWQREYDGRGLGFLDYCGPVLKGRVAGVTYRR